MQNNFPSFIQALSQSGGGQFAWLYGHVSKSSGEVTNRKIQVGFSYMDLLGRAIVAAKQIDPATILANCPDCTSIEQATAVLDRVRAAYAKRQAGPQQSPFVPVDDKGRLVETGGKLYITGLHVDKWVVTPGEYKPRNKAVETKIREWIEFKCDRIKHFRRFTMAPGTWDRFVYNKRVYRPQDIHIMSGQA